MPDLYYLALAGGVAASLRYFVIAWLGRIKIMPLSIIVINIVATFIIVTSSYLEMTAWGRIILIMGVLGAFSTLSSLCSDVYGLYVQRQYFKLVLYLVLTIGGSYLALLLGHYIGKHYV